MLGDEAVAVNPGDTRYENMHGKRVTLPLRDKPIPIIVDESVDPKFGTGCVKVTPAHDPADYEMAQRHHLPLTVVIAPGGTMTQEAGESFAGMDRMEARKAVVAKMEAAGLLLKIEKYVHRVGYGQRSHVPIEPYLSEQWFLEYSSMKESRGCVAQDGFLFATNLHEKTVLIVPATGKEFPGQSIHELRKAAHAFVREHGFLGVPFKNEDSGIGILDNIPGQPVPLSLASPISASHTPVLPSLSLRRQSLASPRILCRVPSLRLDQTASSRRRPISSLLVLVSG